MRIAGKFKGKSSLFSPEDSKSEGPQHQRLPQLKLLPLLHDMAPSQDKGRVECSEEERLLPGDTINQRHSEYQRKLHFFIVLLTSAVSERHVILKSAWIYWPVFLQTDEVSIKNTPAMLICAERQSVSGTDPTHTGMLAVLSRIAATEQSQVHLVGKLQLVVSPPPPAVLQW